jgi:hypothetical protein
MSRSCESFKKSPVRPASFRPGPPAHAMAGAKSTTRIRDLLERLGWRWVVCCGVGIVLFVN